MLSRLVGGGFVWLMRLVVVVWCPLRQAQGTGWASGRDLPPLAELVEARAR